VGQVFNCFQPARRFLIGAGTGYEPVRRILPHSTQSDKVSRRGHTNGDATVYFPALRVLHTGDLVTGTSPLIDYGGGGSPKEWAATLDGAMKLDFDTMIPGHGPVGKNADMLSYRNNVEKLRMEVTDILRQNKSRDEIAKVVQDKYGWAPTGLQFQVGFDGMLAELKR
jgi:glyoxylase-like metal-dependent hydrolase (beta-lactamase superfamily II)